MQEVWTSSQLSLLEPLARRRTVKRGGVLFKAGQRDMGLAVVLRGEVQIVEQRDGIEQELAVGHERDFIGDGDVARHIRARDSTSDIGRSGDPVRAGS